MSTFCTAEEAAKRMLDGDIIENLNSNYFLKKEKNFIFQSFDCIQWTKTTLELHTFFNGDSWRSLSNLSYYQELKERHPYSKLNYLCEDDSIVDEYEKKADKTKRRWFVGGILG